MKDKYLKFFPLYLYSYFFNQHFLPMNKLFQIFQSESLKMLLLLSCNIFKLPIYIVNYTFIIFFKLNNSSSCYVNWYFYCFMRSYFSVLSILIILLKCWQEHIFLLSWEVNKRYQLDELMIIWCMKIHISQYSVVLLIFSLNV